MMLRECVSDGLDQRLRVCLAMVLMTSVLVAARVTPIPAGEVHDRSPMKSAMVVTISK